MPDARYSVKIRPRMLDPWVTVMATDDIERASDYKLQYELTGNYSVRIWDNVKGEWVS
jgi:hypothetical protein